MFWILRFVSADAPLVSKINLSCHRAPYYINNPVRGTVVKSSIRTWTRQDSHIAEVNVQTRWQISLSLNLENRICNASVCEIKVSQNNVRTAILCECTALIYEIQNSCQDSCSTSNHGH